MVIIHIKIIHMAINIKMTKIKRTKKEKVRITPIDSYRNLVQSLSFPLNVPCVVETYYSIFSFL